MTISHSDFFRILPKALKSYPYEQHENVVTVSMHNVSSGTDLSLSPVGRGEITIILSEERCRKVASLTLPVTGVTFQLKSVAESTKRIFFEQFDRAYHRGGG